MTANTTPSPAADPAAPDAEMIQTAMEEEDEGAMSEFGIILGDSKKSSANALIKYVTQPMTYYENHNEERYDL
ncbi:hypothetical protein N7G274_003765 [Stereocaulon virgatum]|uniref:Uncharacterized protein n=1 Tax=Stereocaulon virgatum TaxID=373712 RepID=A0ABR4AEG5_9LECA